MIITISDTQGRENLGSFNTAMPNCASIVAPELAIHPLLHDLVKSGSHSLKPIYPPVRVSEYEYDEIVDQVK